MQTKFWNEAMFSEPWPMEEFQQITDRIFYNESFFKLLKYVEEQQQFSKEREAGRKIQPTFRTRRRTNDLICPTYAHIDHTSFSRTSPETCWLQGWVKRLLCDLQRRACDQTDHLPWFCFSIWILPSASFLVQQGRPETVPILAEDFGMFGRSIDTGFYLSPKHEIEMFPSVSFPGLSGSWTQWSRAAICLQPGMLTDVKAGARAGLSCLVWPIITHQVRLSILLKPNQRSRWHNQTAVPQGAKSRVC